jgi:hypothetical protein
LTSSQQFGFQIHEPWRQSAVFLIRYRFIVERFSCLFSGRITIWSANTKQKARPI